MKCPSPVVSHLASPPHLLPTGVMSVKQYKTYFKESFTQCSSFVSRRRLENLYFTSSNDGRGRTRRTEALFVSYLSLCVSRPSLDIWTAPVAAQPSSSTPSTEMCRLLPSCLPALRNANFVDCKTPKWISHSHKVEANWSHERREFLWSSSWAEQGISSWDMAGRMWDDRRRIQKCKW